MYLRKFVFENFYKTNELRERNTYSLNLDEHRRNSCLNYVTLKMAASFRDKKMLPFEINPKLIEKENIFFFLYIVISLKDELGMKNLLEDSDLLNSDADMVDKIEIRYNPECFSSFHYMLMVSLMVLKLSAVASLAFDI